MLIPIMILCLGKENQLSYISYFKYIFSYITVCSNIYNFTKKRLTSFVIFIAPIKCYLSNSQQNITVINLIIFQFLYVNLSDVNCGQNNMYRTSQIGNTEYKDNFGTCLWALFRHRKYYH